MTVGEAKILTTPNWALHTPHPTGRISHTQFTIVFDMEGHLEHQVTEISQTPGVVGVMCTDPQGLSLAARGTLKPESSGLVSGLASQAASLNHGAGDDDKPTVIVEFETGSILIRGQENSTLGIHKV